VFSDILQPTHLLFILVVALLVLGPKRLPEVGRSLGRGLRDFRNALSGEDHDEVPTDIGPPPPEQPEPATHDEPAQQPEHVA
jgi:sec-independent protein translocase protein TatA